MIILAGGSLAFFMIMSEFFLIKRTSVVTLSVCGIFKEVATIFISSMVFGDILTLINIIGLCITLFGIALYNWLKLKMVTSKARKEIRDQELNRNDGLEGIEEDDDSDEEEMSRNTSHHLYSTVAESTPILLIDGGMSNYRDSEDDRHLLADDDDDDVERSGRHNRFEMR
jgi:solute carrier family 35 protein C2